MTATATTSPSLALIKYWGKLQGDVNIPATSSLAVSLAAFTTTTAVTESQDDTLTVDGVAQPADRLLPVLNAIRARSSSPAPVRVTSNNDFPTAAGLASSSSGFAALALGLDAYFGSGLSTSELSAIARLGSGSAARAVFGGVTTWRAGEQNAQPLYRADHWPGLRVLVVILQDGRKSVSSRAGMEGTKKTSPFYEAWTATSPLLFDEGCAGFACRDLEKLGAAMRQSYLRMFSTMFTSDPPLIYWLPDSVAVIRRCEELRAGGVSVWETMDAGPQVKLVTEDRDAAVVTAAIEETVPGATVISSAVGGDPTVSVSGGG